MCTHPLLFASPDCILVHDSFFLPRIYTVFFEDFLTAIKVDGSVKNLMDTSPTKKNTLPPSQKKKEKSVSASYLTFISFSIYRVAIIAVVTMLVGFVAIKGMVFGKDVEHFSR